MARTKIELATVGCLAAPLFVAWMGCAAEEPQSAERRTSAAIEDVDWEFMQLLHVEEDLQEKIKGHGGPRCGDETFDSCGRGKSPNITSLFVSGDVELARMYMGMERLASRKPRTPWFHVVDVLFAYETAPNEPWIASVPVRSHHFDGGDFKYVFDAWGNMEGGEITIPAYTICSAVLHADVQRYFNDAGLVFTNEVRFFEMALNPLGIDVQRIRLRSPRVTCN